MGDSTHFVCSTCRWRLPSSFFTLQNNNGRCCDSCLSHKSAGREHVPLQQSTAPCVQAEARAPSKRQRTRSLREVESETRYLLHTRAAPLDTPASGQPSALRHRSSELQHAKKGSDQGSSPPNPITTESPSTDILSNDRLEPRTSLGCYTSFPQLFSWQCTASARLPLDMPFPGPTQGLTHEWQHHPMPESYPALHFVPSPSSHRTITPALFVEQPVCVARCPTPDMHQAFMNIPDLDTLDPAAALEADANFQEFDTYMHQEEALQEEGDALPCLPGQNMIPEIREPCDSCMLPSLPTEQDLDKDTQLEQDCEECGHHEDLGSTEELQQQPSQSARFDIQKSFMEILKQVAEDRSSPPAHACSPCDIDEHDPDSPVPQPLSRDAPDTQQEEGERGEYACFVSEHEPRQEEVTEPPRKAQRMRRLREISAGLPPAEGPSPVLQEYVVFLMWYRRYQQKREKKTGVVNDPCAAEACASIEPPTVQGHRQKSLGAGQGMSLPAKKNKKILPEQPCTKKRPPNQRPPVIKKIVKTTAKGHTQVKKSVLQSTSRKSTMKKISPKKIILKIKAASTTSKSKATLMKKASLKTEAVMKQKPTARNEPVHNGRATPKSKGCGKSNASTGGKTAIVAKICNFCEEMLPIEMYRKDNRRQDGREGRCSSCRGRGRKPET